MDNCNSGNNLQSHDHRRQDNLNLRVVLFHYLHDDYNGYQLIHYLNSTSSSLAAEDGNLLTNFVQYLDIAFEELMGQVDSGLSEEYIAANLKTRRYVCTDQDEICVICQAEYEAEETIASLPCRHQYHAECIKRWLEQKNNCPLCKVTAISEETQ